MLDFHNVSPNSNNYVFYMNPMIVILDVSWLLSDCLISADFALSWHSILSPRHGDNDALLGLGVDVAVLH